MPMAQARLPARLRVGVRADRRRPGRRGRVDRAVRTRPRHPGDAWQLGVVAVLDGVLGTALGLFASAFAATEFQAVQMMPAVMIPQILLCGLLIPRDQLPTCCTRSATSCRCRTPSTPSRRCPRQRLRRRRRRRRPGRARVHPGRVGARRSNPPPPHGVGPTRQARHGSCLRHRPLLRGVLHRGPTPLHGGGR